MMNNLFISFVILCSFVMGDLKAATLESSPQNFCSNKNEQIKCVKECPPERTCKNREILFSCYNPEETPCEEKCVCKDGFYRNPKGQCITKAQCEQCQGPNEVFACGSACDNECGTLHEMNQTACPIVNIVCNDKCYCYETHARNSEGKCIPIEDCDK